MKVRNGFVSNSSSSSFIMRGMKLFTSDVIKTLGSLKEKVIQEIAEDAKGKGGREINYFEKAKDER